MVASVRTSASPIISRTSRQDCTGFSPEMYPYTGGPARSARKLSSVHGSSKQSRWISAKCDASNGVAILITEEAWRPADAGRAVARNRRQQGVRNKELRKRPSVGALRCPVPNILFHSAAPAAPARRYRRAPVTIRIFRPSRIRPDLPLHRVVAVEESTVRSLEQLLQDRFRLASHRRH